MNNETILLSSINIDDRFRDVLSLTEDNVIDLLDDIPRNGLIQPIIVVKNNDGSVRLAAGGRRFRALTLLGHKELYHGITCDPARPGFVYATELPEAQRRLIEISENRNRQDVGWRTECKETAEFHRLKKNESVLLGKTWSLEDTGRLLGGYSPGHVSYCIQLAKLCDSSDFDACETITDAVKLLYRNKEDAAMAALASKTKLIQPATITSFDLTFDSEDEEQPSDTTSHIIDLSSMLFQGDSIRTVLPSWPEACVDHIICDPPYGIDVDMMQQASGAVKGIDRITSTHQVGENEDLLDIMFPVLYRILKPTGFCICFADQMQWQRLYDNAIAAGFKVQRWPFTWCKTSTCMNQYAQANFTKNTEIAIVCRKTDATLGRPVQTSYLTCPRDETQSNPFAKPFTLWEFLINAVSLQGQTILDPFAGEGSSTISALRTFRRPIAIEKDPTHFPYLLENVKNYYTQTFKNVTFK